MCRDFRKLKRKLERISQYGLGAAELNWRSAPLNFDGYTRYRVRLLLSNHMILGGFYGTNAADKVCTVRYG